MASVDSLLRIIAARGAESLTIESGSAPVLRRRGENQPLSMPPLAGAMVDAFVSEVLPSERRAAFDEQGRLDFRYDSDDAGSFAVQARRSGNGTRLIFHTAGPPTASAVGNATEPPPRPRTTPVPVPLIPQPRSAVRAVASGDEPGEAPGSGLMNALRRADAFCASDVIFTTGEDTRMRVGGELQVLDGVRADDAAIRELLTEALTEEARAELERRGSVDLAVDHRALGGSRYRVNLFRQSRGLAAAFRPIRTRPPSLEELGLPSALERVTRFPHGLVLVTGPAGSGKSTTLVALAEHINQSRARHIITIEDPIEYEYRSARSLVHQREVGREVASFGTGLRDALRESPDVIVVGEMRDLSTISAVITAAETGHLVLSTLHTNRAADAIDRVIDVFPAHQQRQVRVQLASVLRAVVTQFLLPTTDPPERIPATEILHVNRAVAAMIRDDKSHQIDSQIQTGRDAGMVPLDRALAALVRSGRVTFEAASAVTSDPDELRDLVRLR